MGILEGLMDEEKNKRLSGATNRPSSMVQQASGSSQSANQQQSDSTQATTTSSSGQDGTTSAAPSGQMKPWAPMKPGQTMVPTSPTAWTPPHSGYMSGSQFPLLRGGVTVEAIKGMTAGQALGYTSGIQIASKLSNTDLDMQLAKNADQRQAALAQYIGEDRDEKKAIQKGMRDSAQKGGYSGVIDFLLKADPDRAIAFTKSKVALDQSIMESSVYQMAHENDKLKVMQEAYGALGNMFQAVQNGDPKDKDAMYQQMLPMVRSVVPNAPDRYDASVAAMGTLAVAQATPANILFNAKLTAQTSDTLLGKYNHELSILQAKGATADNSQQYRDTVKSIEGLRTINDQKQDLAMITKLKLGEAELKSSTDAQQLQQKSYQFLSQVQSNYDKASKDTIQTNSDLLRVNAAYSSLQKDPTNPAAQFAYARSAAMLYNKGVLTEPDSAVFRNLDAGTIQLMKYVTSQTGVGSNGLQTPLKPNEIGLINRVVQDLQKFTAEKQQKVNTYYQGLEGKFPSIKSIGGIRYYNQAPEAALQYLQQNPSPENQRAFEDKYHYKAPLRVDDQ